jgi:hypothetical protein
LVEELQELWRGVDEWDIYQANGRKKFILHAILIWKIFNLLTYGLLLKQVTKGYKGYPTYGPNITS